MKRDLALRLTPAQTYYLRELISAHADCRLTGWAELMDALDANCAAIARSEITYGAVPVKDLLAFKEMRSTTR